MPIPNRLLKKLSSRTFKRDSLNLIGTELTDKDISKLCKLITKSKNIKKLYLSYTLIKSYHVDLLKNLDLDELDVSWTRIDNRGASELIKKGTLKSLKIGGNLISDDGLIGIDSNTSLIKLDIYPSNIHSEGAKLISKNKSLKYLNLSQSYIGNEGLKYLSQHPTLEELMLYGAELSDDGMQYIAENSILKTVWLGANQIGIKGIKELCKNKSIKRLSLNNNKLDDECAELLTRMPSLEMLDVLLNEFTKTGVGILKTSSIKDVKAFIIPRNLKPLKELEEEDADLTFPPPITFQFDASKKKSKEETEQEYLRKMKPK